MASVALEHVSKTFPDGTAAVRDVTLTIDDGEFMVLVGPSGCGKSTVLNMIAGLEAISSGELRIGGQRMNERTPRERDVAMVFQSYALYPTMTVRENMAFPLRLAGWDAADIDQKVDETARLLELDVLLDRKPASLSGGQRQRVAMARALVRRPRAYLLDEPLSNLDATLRVDMRAELSRLQRHLRTTTVYVTHDQTEAMTLGDRLAVMRSGAVQQVGEPQDVYNKPSNLFVAGFIGSPPMNLLPARIDGRSLRTGIGTVLISEPLEQHLASIGAARELTLGIRPEHLRDVLGSDEPAAADSVECTVQADLVESTGSDTYVYASLDGTMSPVLRSSLVVRVPPTALVRAGDRRRLQWSLRHVHLFDPVSGRCLVSPGSVA